MDSFPQIRTLFVSVFAFGLGAMFALHWEPPLSSCWEPPCFDSSISRSASGFTLPFDETAYVLFAAAATPMSPGEVVQSVVGKQMGMELLSILGHCTEDMSMTNQAYFSNCSTKLDELNPVSVTLTVQVHLPAQPALPFIILLFHLSPSAHSSAAPERYPHPAIP